MKIHQAALETAIKTAGTKLSGEDAPLIALCRSLAIQMDKTNSQPGSRLVGSYLTAIRSLNAATKDRAPGRSVPQKGETPLERARRLAQARAERGA